MLWGAIFGGLAKWLPQAKDIIEAWRGSQKERDRNQHDELIAIHAEQQAGMTIGKPGRTRFDVFIDGINRLPRPLITFGIIWLFIWAGISPDRFAVSMRALSTVPDPMWVILGCTLAFWFGGRMSNDLVASARQYRREVPTQTQATFNAPVSANSHGGAANVAKSWKEQALNPSS